ncbi:iron chelate uptake ABC transporter family permease subunit [Roseibium salinum]|nr:iron chelate uptake ABC transporter family permease subunit [Roseibium salinum]
MAPHLARRAGLVGTLPQILGAATLGALVMTIADYFGRIAWFPWQLPAGIVATLIGGPVLVIFLLKRQGKAA